MVVLSHFFKWWQMKIEMVSMAFTPFGVLEKGEILTTKRYPKDFLQHLVNDCGAAKVLDYETKVETIEQKVIAPELDKKKELSQSSPVVQVSHRQTLTRSRAKSKKQ